MDEILFIISTLITIIWSVWLYTAWENRAGLPESSSVRLFILIGPSVYVFLLAVSSWVKSVSIRLDILGLMGLTIVSLLCAAVLFVLMKTMATERKAYVAAVSAYNGAAVLIIAAIYLVRFYPPLLIRLAAFLRQVEQFEITSMGWMALNPENHEQDLVSLINKIVIAFCSYIPISVLRMLYMSRQRKRMQRDLEALEKRIGELESQVSGVR